MEFLVKWLETQGIVSSAYWAIYREYALAGFDLTRLLFALAILGAKRIAGAIAQPKGLEF